MHTQDIQWQQDCCELNLPRYCTPLSHMEISSKACCDTILLSYAVPDWSLCAQSDAQWYLLVQVRFEYEFHDDEGKWFRAHGNEVQRLLLLK